MDITGYFMHINRARLLQIVLQQLDRLASHKTHKGRWGDEVDLDFVKYLTREIIMQDPTISCKLRGSKRQWAPLPASKSLFFSPEGCGLPIGNLTSQLFSNVYLNVLDQYMKRQLGCRHYGRYVDDFFVVSTDREWLLSLREPVTQFLHDALSLNTNQNKTLLLDVHKGTEFLGAFILPYRMYVSHRSLRRMKRKIPHLTLSRDAEALRSSVNSFLGIMGHYRSYQLRHRIFYPLESAHHLGYFHTGMSKFVAYPFDTATITVESP